MNFKEEECLQEFLRLGNTQIRLYARRSNSQLKIHVEIMAPLANPNFEDDSFPQPTLQKSLISLLCISSRPCHDVIFLPKIRSL